MQPPRNDEGMRKKAQSMTAVNNGGGRDANSGGAIRRDSRRESGGSGAGPTNGARPPNGHRVADQRRRPNEVNDSPEDQSQQHQGPFSISLRDIGGLHGMGQMGSFSRGLLSSSPNSAGLDGAAAASHSREKDKSTIFHGRRVGQAKRLAQPGRLVAMNAGVNGRR